MCNGHSTQRERNNGHIEIITVEKVKYRQKNEDGCEEREQKERKKVRKNIHDVKKKVKKWRQTEIG